MKKNKRAVCPPASRIDGLKHQHALLDEQIAEMQRSPGSCQLQLSSLKQKKLRLKDEIFSSSRQIDQVATR